MYLRIRKMAAQITDGGKQVKNVTQRGQPYDKNFHYGNLGNYLALAAVG